MSGSVPPPPSQTHMQLVRRRKKKITRRIYRRYASLKRSRVFGSSTKPNGCDFAKIYASVCDNNFPSFVASRFSWRCLAASTSSFLHAAMNHLYPPSVAVSIHTSAFAAVAFQSPAMSNTRMPLFTESVQSFSFSPHPICTAPSRFPNTIRFGGSTTTLIC